MSVTLARSRAPSAASGGDGPPLGISSEVIAGQPSEALVKTSVYLALMNSVSAASCPARRANLSVAPLLLEPHFVQPRRRQRLDAADDQIIMQIAARQPVAVDLEHVGVEGQPLQPGQLLQIDVDGEVEPVLIDGALLRSAGSIAQDFADIGRRELDAVFLERIRQQAERRFLDGAFARIGIGGLQVVGLLVFLRESHACGRGKQNHGDEPGDFQDVARNRS